MKTLLHLLAVGSCWILLGTADVSGQKFVNLDDEFGLGYVEIVFQDSYGIFWIASRNGLSRFDGYNITHFTNDPVDSTTIPDNNVVSVSEDKSRNIWVTLGSKGLAVMNRDTESFRKVCPTGMGFDCTQETSYLLTIQDTSDNLWVGTSRGLLLMAEDGSIRKWYKHSEDDPSSLYKDYVYDIFLDDQKRVWVGTISGINLLDRKTETFETPLTNPDFIAEQILDVDQRPGGPVMISPRFGDDCLLSYNEDRKSFEAIPEFTNREMGEFKFTFDHDGGLWISSRGVGAYYQPPNGEGVISYLPEQAAIHGYRNIYGLDPITDKYGNVWMAGPQLHYMPASGKNIRNIDSEGNIVISVFADQDYVWYCSEKPYRWNKKTMQAEDFWKGTPTNLRGKRVLSKPRMYEFISLDDQHILMASTRNIYIWNREDDTYKEYASHYGGPFRDIAYDAKRQCFWICGNQGSPIHFELETGAFSRLDELLSVRNPQAVEVDVDGSVWFGTITDGVIRFNPETGDTLSFSVDSPLNRRLSSRRINDIEIGRNGDMWFATTLGLNHWDSDLDSIVVYRKDQSGLESDLIASVLLDNTGRVWMGTGKGLSVFDPTDKTFRHYGDKDGLISSYYITRSCHRDEQGMLYFGGNQGIDIFSPDEMGINTVPPDIYFSAIRVNDQPYITDSSLFKIKRLELNHTQNFVEIELLALHTTAPHANSYAYRIRELREEWTELGHRRIVALANSSPGTFTLEARAANADGVWCEPEELLTIVISPPYYRTWWFISICVALLGLILYAGYRYRIDQIRKGEELKTEFNKQIAQLEMKALRAQMNPHFLFNSLNSIKSLISAGETDKAAEYVTRFSQLIRQVLSNSEQPVVRLQEDLNALRLYMEIERMRFQNFIYTIEVTADVNADFIEVPPLLLQPYVENAIWHGLLHKTNGERKLDVRVNKKDDILIMEVEDNGIGRERAKSIKMRGGSRKGGLGMKITGDRIRVLKDYFGQEATVEVIDLKEDGGSAAGTLVRVCIPVPE